MAYSTVFAAATTATGAQLDDDLNEAGLVGTVPCTATGTNSLTLTPYSAPTIGTPPVAAYQQLLRFSCIAPNTNTGATQAAVASLSRLNVYKDTPTGPSALVGGEIAQNNLIVLVYDATLNSGTGGFHLQTPPISASGAVTSIATAHGVAGGPITNTGTISLAGIANNQVVANVSGGVAAPVATSLTSILDILSTSQGSILSRGASVWAGNTETTFTPTITFGGGSTSVTYATQQGYYFQVGYMNFVSYNIVLASKGSSTGAMAISLPVAAGAGSRVGGGLVASYTSLSSISLGLWSYVAPSATVASIYTAGAGSTVAVLDTNAQNSTALAGVIMYFTG